MFRHQGSSRTLRHNLSIATVLSFVAGIINVVGFLAYSQLTTHVTGHFSLIINDFADFEFWKGSIYLLYILSFLFGSFLSGFLIEKFRESKRLNVFVVPTVIECIIFISIGIYSNYYEVAYADLIVCLLLFTMGLQNSFVTKISNAVVRTTHLTGLFTDLGIDISQLFFPRSLRHKKRLRANVKLRLYIILFFFLGGLLGVYFFTKLNWKLNTLFIPAFILLLSLFYDDLRVKVRRSRHKYLAKKKDYLN